MREADFLAITYEHRATVIRPVLEHSGAFDDFTDTEVYSDLSCAVSFSQGSKDGESDTTQAVEYSSVLFARPEVEILPGDRLTVDVHGQQYEFLAGEGARYSSHIEIPLFRKEVA